MASTWEDLLQIELQATGENSTTWGAKTNDNFERLADAIAGHASINLAGGGNYTISQSQSLDTEGRKAFLTLTGLRTATCEITVPSFSKIYYVRNTTTGDYTISFKTSGGSAVTIRTTGVTVVVCDGSECYVGNDGVLRTGDTMTGALAITSGGLTVAGNVSVSGTLNVLGNVSLGGTLGITGAVIVSGVTNFRAAVSFANPVVFGGAITINTAVCVSGATTFTQAVSLASTLVASGVATFRAGVSVSGTANILGAVSVGGAATFSAAVSLASTLNVLGATSVGGAFTAGSTVSVVGTATFLGAVTVVGAAEFKAAVCVAGAMAVGGNFLVAGDVDVAGVGTFASVSVLTSVGIIAGNAAKAWANFAGASGAIAAAYGISSVTRTGAGQYTISFTAALTNANYAVMAQTNIDGMNNGNRNIGTRVYDLTTGNFKTATNGDNTFVDPDTVHVVVFNY